ncbi:hypothetical protein [Variovorax saccharolyticus]|uniref:hypothetical protein n=1 Tax=Variovorax saccharolyticus TaxID=3053516 RepID=UPI0025782D7A|nr:hypothetical protein [Variovorax sp. J31P216]MDM0024118.1 hypothetical protein [Variovorax sp. J31P216]
MNKEVKAKWVAALRSGKYEQAHGELRGDENAFCCLGVLCEISGVGSWGYDSETGLPEKAYCAGTAFENDLPPHAVLDWAGFSAGAAIARRIPKVTIGGDEEVLHDHNDGGRTFAEIADAIEAQL